MTRGAGEVFRRKYKDASGTWRTASTWSIRYYDRRGCRQIREGGFKTEKAANKRLRSRLTDQDRGVDIGARYERTTFEDLASLVTSDYKVNGRRSLDRVERSLKALREWFGDDRAIEITEDRIQAFVAGRLKTCRAATVNRDLATLRRGFRLAHFAQRVARVPRIKPLQEDNVRKGFFEEEQYRAVRRHLSPELQVVVDVAYVTGWRVKSEILSRQWRHVDLKGHWLRLEPGETKNREGRQFPLDPDLLKLLRAQNRATRALEREQRRIIPWVFHREGQPIRCFRAAWVTACKDAGVPGRLLHDFRRTAVRNLERAGVPRSAAMAMVGHKTESIYRRYAIVDETMLREAGEKLAAARRKRR